MPAPADSGAEAARAPASRAPAGRLDIPARERLIFALDVPDFAAARALVERLGDAVGFYKIGLELILAGDGAGGGYAGFVDWLLARDKRVLADVKIFDIPRTTAAAVRQLREQGVAMATVHGNDEILRAAAREKGDELKILAVTVLTSLDRGDMEDLGFQTDIPGLVVSRARRALELGCDGVIASGVETPEIRATLDERFLIAVPGVRPTEESRSDDQKRTVSVEEAFSGGADYIVVGRPIRHADDPRAAAEAIQARIASIIGA